MIQQSAQHYLSPFMAKTFIRKTCPCNEYPLKPHFYIVKMGYAGVYYTIFLNLGPKHRSWILVRSEVVLRCTHDLCFERKKKNISLNIFIAPAYSRVRYRSPNFGPSSPSTFMSKFCFLYVTDSWESQSLHSNCP